MVCFCLPFRGRRGARFALCLLFGAFLTALLDTPFVILPSLGGIGKTSRNSAVAPDDHISSRSTIDGYDSMVIDGCMQTHTIDTISARDAVCVLTGVCAVAVALYYRRRHASSSQGRLSSCRQALNTERSDRLFKEAIELMPGGVSSPVRAFKSVGGKPVLFDRVKGAHAWDIDGNEYVDFVGSFGPAILGHADDEVLLALRSQMAKGTSFGAPSLLENTLAKMVIDAVPSIEMLRFTNSGTEACMGMVRLARAYTKREVIIKFEGSYHGHADCLLVQATRGLPDSPGVPKSVVSGTMCAQYNNLESVERLLQAGDVAAVILEPVAGNCGFIPPSRSFLVGLREMTSRYGALLVFDEVMTGFRIAYGGAQEYFGVVPDITTLGKIIGGGLPVGAYGGRRDIMELVAPAGSVYQAGTLSGNPLAMTAGIVTLRRLQDADSYRQLDHIAGKMVTGIIDAARAAGHPICGSHINGMFGYFFCEGPVACFADARRSDTDKYARWHRMMLERGVYLAPSQFEACFVSLAHTDEDVNFALAASRDVFSHL